MMDFNVYCYFVLHLHLTKEEFYVHVTVHRKTFLCNKTN